MASSSVTRCPRRAAVSAGAELDAFSRPPMLRRLGAAKVRFRESHSVLALEEGRVLSRENWTGQQVVDEADAVVCAWYGVADDALVGELTGRVEVRAVGDALAPRRAIDAIWDGFRVGVQA